MTTIDYGKSIYAKKYVGNIQIESIVDDFNEYQFPDVFDCVWISHVLEHQLNANAFLKRVCSLVKDGGVVVITVPPLKHEIVGGHVTLWNAGLLLYNLVLAGIDCSAARILQYGYNISIITEVKHIQLPELAYDYGDVNRIAYS